MKRVAVVCANGLGDALLFMILAHNLSLSGVRVTTFSSILCEMREWFPGQTITPFPCPTTFEQTFAAFDTVIAADHAPVTKEHNFGNQLIILKENNFDKKLTLVDNLQQVCQNLLALPYFEKGNGLIVPHGLTWQGHPKRVVIHPMSIEAKRTWPAAKFITLGKRLEKLGYDPFFCVSPTERVDWIKLVCEDKLPLFPTVHDLASFVFESGSMIGNNSGIGHLASLLNVPTLTLFARKSYSRLWRPGWGPGLVVTPPNILPGSRLKQKYWKHLLSVKRVVNKYMKMGAER